MSDDTGLEGWFYSEKALRTMAVVLLSFGKTIRTNLHMLEDYPDLRTRALEMLEKEKQIALQMRREVPEQIDVSSMVSNLTRPWMPENQAFSHNLVHYFYFTGLVSREEGMDLFSGRAPRHDRLIQRGTEWKRELDPEHDRGAVVDSAVQAAEKIREIRGRNENVKVALVKGKWNGIPHFGYLMMFAELFAHLNGYEGMAIREENIMLTIAADTNHNLRTYGQTVPFLNTAWRSSLLRRIRVVDLVFSAGDFQGSIVKHWERVHEQIRPDYTLVDPQHKYRIGLMKQAKLYAGNAIELPRLRLLNRDGEREIISSSRLRSGWGQDGIPDLDTILATNDMYQLFWDEYPRRYRNWWSPDSDELIPF